MHAVALRFTDLPYQMQRRRRRRAELQQLPDGQRCQRVLLVGGFAGSPALVQRMRQELEGRAGGVHQVVVAEHAASAVVKGGPLDGPLLGQQNLLPTATADLYLTPEFRFIHVTSLIECRPAASAPLPAARRRCRAVRRHATPHLRAPQPPDLRRRLLKAVLLGRPAREQVLAQGEVPLLHARLLPAVRVYQPAGGCWLGPCPLQLSSALTVPPRSSSRAS